MIGRKNQPPVKEEFKPKGFDDFELRLGDLMRGERATLAKSLLDVQRELRIKAAHIAAIEASDASVFETPSFIAGYVRSYARYLGMDADWAFERFCLEANFTPTHGMSAAASGPKTVAKPVVSEPLANPNASFVPRTEAIWTKIEPRAVGSLLVLLALAGGIGYGGWSVLQEVQRVQLAPVDQAPGIVAELDPLQSVTPLEMADAQALSARPQIETTDRLYRPQALDVPKFVSRDGPISAIDPTNTGLLATVDPTGTQGDEGVDLVVAEVASQPVRALAEDAPEVEILAVRPSWVRVVSAEGSVILEKVLDAGERFALPKLEAAPIMRTGESGAIYFAVNGVAHGPVGTRGQVTKNIELSPEYLAQTFAVANIAKDQDLATMIAVADASRSVLGALAGQ